MASFFGIQCRRRNIKIAKAGAVEVTEFFGRDETPAHLSFACAEMLSARAPGNSKRVAAFAQLLAIYIAEKSKKSAPLFRKNTTGVARSPRLQSI